MTAGAWKQSALSVRCPWCGAGVGMRCDNGPYGKLPGVHGQRLKAFTRQQDEQDGIDTGGLR